MAETKKNAKTRKKAPAPKGGGKKTCSRFEARAGLRSASWPKADLVFNKFKERRQ